MANNELNEWERLIMNHLVNGESLNMSQLAKKVDVSYPTILKYTKTLSKKGWINIRDFGNVKIIEAKR